MDSISEVPFKVYYQDEIRRFSMPERVSNGEQSYASLVQRIQSVFDIPPTQPLRLRWLDPEGDRIVFSCSGELADAIGELSFHRDVPGAAVRIYVSDGGSPKGDAFDQSAIVHPGVFCDGCNTSLRGYRFKCLVCPDYDLCLACLNRDTHSQHQMTLIRRPGDGWGCGKHAGMILSRFRGGGGGGGGCPVLQQMSVVAEAQVSGRSDQGRQRCPRFCAMRDAAATSTGAVVVNSGASTPPLVTSTASVGTERQVEQVNSAITTAQLPLSTDASIQVTRQESEASVQASAACTASSEAAIKASCCGTESSAGPCGPALTQSHFRTPQTQPPPESSAAFHAEPLETSSASFVAGSVVATGSDGGFELVAALDPKIARSLEHMTAMGFNDEGGWLTRLLTAKDGDICAVLDAIRPVGGGK